MKCKACNGSVTVPKGSFTVRYPNGPELEESTHLVMACEVCGKLSGKQVVGVHCDTSAHADEPPDSRRP